MLIISFVLGLGLGIAFKEKIITWSHTALDKAKVVLNRAK